MFKENQFWRMFKENYKLNGYPVIAFKPSTKMDNSVVVVNITDNDLHPYVVASYNSDLKNVWEQGDYCKTRDEAFEIFNSRKI
tara:strand:+ start:195 stop:443 length:249 start_codon:yes stop_codon:yes gene_type:complete